LKNAKKWLLIDQTSFVKNVGSCHWTIYQWESAISGSAAVHDYDDWKWLKLTELHWNLISKLQLTGLTNPVKWLMCINKTTYYNPDYWYYASIWFFYWMLATVALPGFPKGSLLKQVQEEKRVNTCLLKSTRWWLWWLLWLTH